MQSSFLNRTIKSGLAKAGLSVARTDHGIIINRTGSGQRTILHSALIKADSSRSKDLSAARIADLIIDSTGLHMTNQSLSGENLSVTLSGDLIQPATGNTSSTDWQWPDELKNGVRTLIIQYKDTSGEEFCDSYLIDFRQEYQRLFGALYSQVITEPVMGIFMIGLRNKKCFALGWVYDPDYQPAEQHFTLNGIVPTVQFSKSRPDWEIHIGPVSSYFTMKSDRHFSFFDVELDGHCESDQPIILSYQSGQVTTLNRCQGAYFEDQLPIPGSDIFKRVSGDENPFTFRYVGYSTFLKLEALCEKYHAGSFATIDRVLDWGCGCGRVTRYFSKYKSDTEIHGIDIDKTGINWLNENLDFGNFAHIQPNDLTPFPDNHFDFIFGISIFTHLTEEDHFFWLKELQRIVSKNGIIAVTTGSTMMRARMFNVNIGDQVSDQLAGYTDQGHNAQINGSTDNKEYYRNTYITKEYIEAVWSEYFDVLDIHSGLINSLQDMVILRKKS